ncbi:MAG: hypothetical protein JNJ92_02920 [Altererythrobacter sp.]|nr:hypothetical protein [Altererythrobacter sp.]
MSLLSKTPGTRLGTIGAIALGLAWTAATFGAALIPTAANAQATSKIYYRAELVQPATADRAIAGSLVWSCSGNNCVATKGTSRPLRVCREVNRKFGEVRSFTTRGEALPAADLAKCNA